MPPTSAPASASSEPQAELAKLVRPLRAFFLRRVDNPAEVDDLVQELLCRLVARQNDAPLDMSAAYVFQAAANLLRDRARRRSSKSKAHNQLLHDAENHFEEISPERVLMGRDMVARVIKALEMLPERTQAVFLLHRFEGMKYREIASRLGVSESLIEKHMMAAIRHLASVTDQVQ